MTKLKIKNHPHAFSLIEVLFAVFLLSAILFGVIRLELNQINLSETQKNELKAYALSHRNLEKAKSLGEIGLENACAEKSCRCKWTEGDSLECEENAQTQNDLFIHYFLLNQENLNEAWQVESVVEWTDAAGEHTEKNGGAAQIKRIVF